MGWEGGTSILYHGNMAACGSNNGGPVGGRSCQSEIKADAAPPSQPCHSCRACSGVRIHQGLRFSFCYADRQAVLHGVVAQRYRSQVTVQGRTVVPLTRRMRRERRWGRTSGGVGRGVVWGSANEEQRDGARVAPLPTLNTKCPGRLQPLFSRRSPAQSTNRALFFARFLAPNSKGPTCSCDSYYEVDPSVGVGEDTCAGNDMLLVRRVCLKTALG